MNAVVTMNSVMQTGARTARLMLVLGVLVASLLLAGVVRADEGLDIDAYRWQAMADWYEANGMLNIDAQAAADAHAQRWVAMADWYEANGLLNFDYEAAADLMAYRWQAMAEFYAGDAAAIASR